MSQRERKDLVCLLFSLRESVAGHPYRMLFIELLHRLDAEYHILKGC